MPGSQMNYFTRPQGQATYQDILDAPEGMVAEIINGELHTLPQPGPKHINASDELAAELVTHFRKNKVKPGGWTILTEPEVHFSATDIFDPDIAGWRYETMPALPETAYFAMVPDWVGEILSPSTARIDRISKMATYAQHHVGHYWIVDPRAKTLEAYELRDGQWVLIATAGDDDTVRVAPFEDLGIALEYLWPAEANPD